MITLAAFVRARHGGTTVLFAVAIVPLLVMIGAGVDYGRAKVAREQLQSALDTAVLAGLSISAKERIQGKQPTEVAGRVFKANFGTPTTRLAFQENAGRLTGQATAQSPTTIMSLVGYRALDVSVTSTATINNTAKMSACFMAMHPYRKHTLELKGSVSVLAPDCNIYGNSNDEDDVVDPHTPQNFLTGRTVQAVGYGHHYLQNVKPPLAYAPEILPDPLAAFSLPSPGICTSSGRTVSGASPTTLMPGVYCNGLTISGATVSLAPGTYFVKDGDFALNGARISGSGVTIVLGNGARLQWTNADVELAAPTSGSLAGIVVTGERTALSHSFQNSRVDLHGTVYLPKGAFDWTNTGTPTINAVWTSWIIDGVTWDGSGTIKINFEPAKSAIPLPAALSAVIPPIGTGYVRLVK